jgi:hypothetical protein
MLISPDGSHRLSLQRVAKLPRSTWPSADVSNSISTSASPAEPSWTPSTPERWPSEPHLLEDRSADPVESLRVYADPAGHPFCMFLATSEPQ